MTNILPPFKIKTVEPIFFSSKEERIEWIKQANYNLFNLKSDQVIVDFLTDSGTAAMSAEQAAQLITGDESYAGASSYIFFKYYRRYHWLQTYFPSTSRQRLN